MDVRFEGLRATGSGTLVLLMDKSGDLTGTAAILDESLAGLIRRAVDLASPPLDFGQAVDVVCPTDSTTGFDRVVVLGAGDDLDAGKAVELGAAVARLASRLKLETVTVAADLAVPKLTPAALAAGLAEGVMLRTYRFDAMKSKAEPTRSTTSAVVLTSAAAEAAAESAARTALVGGVHIARDLVNRPASSLDTTAFVEAAQELEALGVSVEVLDRDAMAALGMGALLGVARGSAMPPYTVVMRWQGGGAGEAPLALVGKGVVFDSGGLSLKPAKSMETMKCDMAGAAAVLGAMHALAGRKAAANVVGAIGLVENMPAANAQRPGDVVTSLSGKTIEVLNTDAEGRLVLADVLWHVRQTVEPGAIIDFATLTGAIIVALGYEHAGLFANDEALAERIVAAGAATGETVWRMPLGSGYAKQLEGGVADLRNIGRPGQAGSSVAAAFLEAFVGDTPWAHLDIAATSFVDSDPPLGTKGGTGWGVRLVDRLVRDHYER